MKRWIIAFLFLPFVGLSQSHYEGFSPYVLGHQKDTANTILIENTLDGFSGYYIARLGDTVRFHLDTAGMLILHTDTSFRIEFDSLYLDSLVSRRAEWVLVWDDSLKQVTAVDTLAFADSLYFLFSDDHSPPGWYFTGDTVIIDTSGTGGGDSLYFLKTNVYFDNGWYFSGDSIFIDTTFVPPGSVDSTYFWWTDTSGISGWYGLGDTVKIDTTFVPTGSVDTTYFLKTDEYFLNGWYGLGDTVKIDTTFGSLKDSVFVWMGDSIYIWVLDSLTGLDSIYFQWTDTFSNDGWYGTGDTVLFDTTGSTNIYDTLVEGFGILPFRYTPSARDTVAADSAELDEWFTTDTVFNYTVDSIFTYVNDSLYSYLYDTLFISLSDTLFNYFYDSLYNELYDTLSIYLYDSLFVSLYDTLLISTIDSLTIYFNDSIYSWLYDSLYIQLSDTLYSYLYDTLYISLSDTLYQWFYDSLYISLTDSLIIYINDSLGGIDSTYFEWGNTHGEDGWYGTGDTVLLDTSLWAKNNNFLYPKQATDSVHIGGNTPAERLEVTGNIALSSQADRKIYVEKSTGAGDDGYDLEIYAGASNDPGMLGTGKGGDVIIHGGLGDGGGSPAGGNVFIYPINQDQDGGLFLNLDTDTLSSDTRIYLGGVFTKDNVTDSLLVLSRDHTLSWLSKDSIMTNAGDSCLWVIVSGDTIDTKDFNIKLDSSFLMKYGDLRLGYTSSLLGHDRVVHSGVISNDTITAVYNYKDESEYISRLISKFGDNEFAVVSVESDAKQPGSADFEVQSVSSTNGSYFSVDPNIIQITTDSLKIDTLPQASKRFLMAWDSTSGQVFAMDTADLGGGGAGEPDSLFFQRSDQYFETGWYSDTDTVLIDTTGGGGGDCTTPFTLAVYSNRTTDMTASDDTCFYVVDPDAEIDFTIPVGSTATGRSFTVINDNYDADRNKINIKRGSTTDVTVYPDADYYYLSNSVVYTGTEWMIWAMGWEKTEGGFITEWTVAGNEAARTITLPLYNSGTFNCIVDWGDGTAKSDVTAYNDADRVHIYASDGTYQVTIKGECPSWSFNNGGDKLKITKIINWGSSPTFGGFAYLTSGFYGCTNLTSLGHGKILPRSTSLVNLYQTFRDCTSLTTIPNGLLDNCISLAAYAYDQIFYGCTGITTIPVGLFDNGILATTYSFYQAFYGCTGITTIPDGLFDHNTIITTYAFWETFRGCTSIDSIPTGLFNYNKLVSTEGFYQTFRGCTSLDYIPPGLFDYNTAVSSSGFQGTFYGCTHLDYVPSGLFYKCTAVSTNGFYQTFRDCSSLDSIGSTLFKSNSLTTSAFQYTFYQCTSLDTIPDGLFDDCPNITTSAFYGTFVSCQALNYIPPGLFDNNTAVSSNGFCETFSNCYALDSIPDGLFDNNTAVSSNGFYKTFMYCASLVYMPAMLFANNTACTSWSYCFYGCNKLTEKEEVFYHYSDADSTSRFAGKTIDFTKMFQLTDTFTGTQGKAQRLWNATYGSVTSTQCWSSHSSSSLSNYADIPAGWK